MEWRGKVGNRVKGVVTCRHVGHKTPMFWSISRGYMIWQCFEIPLVAVSCYWRCQVAVCSFPFDAWPSDASADTSYKCPFFFLLLTIHWSSRAPASADNKGSDGLVHVAAVANVPPVVAVGGGGTESLTVGGRVGVAVNVKRGAREAHVSNRTGF